MASTSKRQQKILDDLYHIFEYEQVSNKSARLLGRLMDDHDAEVANGPSLYEVNGVVIDFEARRKELLKKIKALYEEFVY